MGVKIYKDGAWEDLEAVRLYADGAWQEKETMKIYNPTTQAWEEARSAALLMKCLSSTLTVGECRALGNGINVSVYQSHNSSKVIYYVDGYWTNPTVSYVSEGLRALQNTSDGNFTFYNAGITNLYYRLASSTGNGTEVNRIEVGNSSGQTEKSMNTTLSGTFNRLGISITTVSATWPEFVYGVTSITVRDIYFDGKRVLADPQYNT